MGRGQRRDQVLGTNEGNVCREVSRQGGGGNFGTDAPGIAQGDGDAGGQGTRILT